MIKMTALSVSIINRVKLKRLIKGVSAKKLSSTLEHESNYIRNIENPERATSYPPHEWPKIAKALNCTIHELLPENTPQNVDELVEKKVLDLNSENDLAEILHGLIRAGFFDEEKTVESVATHLFIWDESQLTLLSKTIKSLKKDGFLNSEENSTFKVDG